MRFRGQKKKLLLVTSGRFVRKVTERIRRFSSVEYELADTVFYDGGAEVPGETQEKLPYKTADITKTSEYILRNWVDEVLICFPRGCTKRESLEIDCLLQNCRTMGVTVYQAVKPHKGTGSTRRKRIGGLCVEARTVSPADARDPRLLVLKRGMDILGGLAGLGLTALLTPVAAALIFSEDPGPVFFQQIRIGKNGRPFAMYKFRSMYRNAETQKQELMLRNEMNGLMFRLEKDPRVLGSGPDGSKHGVGWFLRESFLDEFPQFLSVLAGDMSLVGPRPPTADEWKQYDYHHRARLSMKPGLSGIWQVSGRDNIRDFEEVVAMDVDYIRNWSIRKDMVILLKTVILLLTGRGLRRS